MESTGHSYTDGKLPSSSYSTMFSHPSPPPSAHSSVDIQNQNWSLPQSPQQQQQGDPSSTPAPPESSSSGLSLPPISALYNIAPPGTTTAFSPGLSALPPHLRMGSDNASIETWITPANTAELAGDDDDFDDTNYVYENGRRYHANMEGRILYPLPNDESEQERQDMIHKLALWMMHEKLFYAPIEDTLRQHGGMVFDLGELNPSSHHRLSLSLLLSFSLLSRSRAIITSHQSYLTTHAIQSPPHPRSVVAKKKRPYAVSVPFQLDLLAFLSPWHQDNARIPCLRHGLTCPGRAEHPQLATTTTFPLLHTIYILFNGQRSINRLDAAT